MNNTVNQVQAARDAIQEAADRWPADLFTRQGVETFTNGAVGAGHLANLDSEGNGPEGSFYMGRKRIYPKNNLVKWLQERVEVRE